MTVSRIKNEQVFRVILEQQQFFVDTDKPFGTKVIERDKKRLFYTCF